MTKKEKGPRGRPMLPVSDDPAVNKRREQARAANARRAAKKLAAKLLAADEG